jgi:hypothetical protein
MTIDERLEALTARHEAFTLSVELISHYLKQISNELPQVTDLVKAMVGGIADLTTIMRSHEQRLSKLEG